MSGPRADRFGSVSDYPATSRGALGQRAVCSGAWGVCPEMIARVLIDCLFVIAPHSLLLDIAGPAEAFRLANLHCQRRGQAPRFRLRFAGPMETPPTSVGLALGGLEPLPDRLDAPTWIVLVGQPAAHLDRVTPPIAAKIGRAPCRERV